MADWDPLVNEIFVQAIEAGSPAGRVAVLDRSCRDDADLRRKVEALLMAHDRAGTFLDHPAPGFAASPPGATGEAPTLAAEETGDSAPAPRDNAETRDQPPAPTQIFACDPSPTDDPVPRPITEGPGTRVGPYKLLQQIGEGGMGVVYMAEQEQPVRRKVALKIIKPGMDTAQVVARFEAERQALALMDHPHIAKVLDAGATDTGRPFFVMELVKGVPITEYCDQVQLNPRERLELFVPVCRAIQHAHQKGIIHRDVKPSNVMVTLVDGRPTPRVIDFGVAKATGQRLTEQSLFTQYGAIVGTLEYMSPEQAEMSALDVDTRSDVFSLGVLLYELLTGSTPLERARLREAGYAEILRRIREEEPPRPSTRLSGSGEALVSIAARRHTEPARLTRLVRGELDWIVMRALEKDRTRRYETAAGFARDVERYLADEAVEACPPSRRYRLRKFARKNRGTLTTAAAFALVLLVAAVGGGYLAVRATRAERLARSRLAESEQSRDQAKAVSQFMVEAFRKPDPDQDGRDLKVINMLDAAEARLGSQFAGSPAIRGALLRALGETYVGLGLPARAVEVTTRALALLEASLGPDHFDTLDCRHSLTIAYLDAERPDDAIALNEGTLKLGTPRLGRDHPSTLGSLNTLAAAYAQVGRTAEAIAMGEAALKLSDAKLGPDHPSARAMRNTLAGAYLAAGRTAEAVAMHAENLKRQTAMLGPDHPRVLKTRVNLGDAYRQAGRAAEAIPLDEETLKLALAKLGPDNFVTRMSRVGLAEAYRQAGRASKAIAIYEGLIEQGTANSGPDPLNLLALREHLAEAYRQAGRTADAIAMDEGTLKLIRARPGPPLETSAFIARLANDYNSTWRRAEAIALNRETLGFLTASLGPDHSSTLACRANLADAYRQAGRAAEAIPLDEETLKLTEARLGPDHPETIVSRVGLGETYRQAGRMAEAIAMNEETLKLGTAKLGPDHATTRAVRNNLATAYQQAGRTAEAIVMHEKALEIETARLGSDDPSLLNGRSNLAEAYRQAGRLAEAVAMYEETLKRSIARLGPGHPGTLTVRNNLAAAYQSSGRNEEAIGLLREVAPAIAKAFGPGHPNTLRSSNRLAGLLVQAGRWAEAEPLLRESLKITGAKPPDDWGTFQAQSLLGACLLARGQFAEAEPLLVSGYEGLKARESKLSALDRPRPAEAAARVVRLYEAWGKPEKADEWRRKLGAGELPADPFRR
jgi:serine/threonine protein kinase/tetratricopeptide (TPR) repeat protein